jgi:hypothetical protein
MATATRSITQPNERWTWMSAGLGIVVSAGVLVFEWARAMPIGWAWAGVAAGMLLLAAGAGGAITTKWYGALIDKWYSMSLSRFQALLWTLVVLSAFCTAAIRNLATGQSAPLVIAIPQELWLIMGISLTSAVGKTLILNQKVNSEPAPEEKEQFAKRKVALEAQNPAQAVPMIREGCVAGRTSPEEANWTDMFTGDEVGNQLSLDLGKLQMFYFTLLLVLTYIVGLWTLFAQSTGKIDAFPALDPSMVTLFGISHAGYLAAKAAPHTKTQVS